jgi:hypothetical protein
MLKHQSISRRKICSDAVSYRGFVATFLVIRLAFTLTASYICMSWSLIKFRYNFTIYVGLGVFTAVVMKSIIFWDMTPCSSLSFNRRFGVTYRLHLQGRRNKFSKNQQASRWQTEDEGDTFLRKVG